MSALCRPSTLKGASAKRTFGLQKSRPIRAASTFKVGVAPINVFLAGELTCRCNGELSRDMGEARLGADVNKVEDLQVVLTCFELRACTGDGIQGHSEDAQWRGDHRGRRCEPPPCGSCRVSARMGATHLLGT